MKTSPAPYRNIRPRFWSLRSLSHTACRHGKFTTFLALGLAVVGMTAQSAQAQNTIETYTGAAGGDLGTGTNFTPALGSAPTSSNDVLFNASSAATSTITAESLNFGSFNSLIGETVTNGSATASTLTLGGGSATTDQVAGSNTADLIFINSLATATTNLGVTGTGPVNIAVGQNGRFDVTGGLLVIGAATGATADTLNVNGFTLTLNSMLSAPGIQNIVINAALTGAGSIVKTGNGQNNLQGNDTNYTGGFTIESGSLNEGAANAFGSGSLSLSAIALGDATSITNNLSPSLFIGGANTITRNVTVGASNTATTGYYSFGSGNTGSRTHIDGTFTLNQNFYVNTNSASCFIGDTGPSAIASAVTSGSTGTQTLTLNGAGNQFVGAVIGGGTGTIAVTKVGGGNGILAAADTYTGTTTVNQGTLTLAGSLTGSPAVVVGGGTFAYNPGTYANSSGVNADPAFTATTGNTQALGGVTVNTGNSAVTVTTGNTLNLGGITRSGNGTLGFTSTGTGTITTTTASGATGILGTYAYTGAGATLSYVTPNATTGAVAAYTGGTGATTASGVTDTSGTVNYNLSAVGTAGTTNTFAAGTSANTVRYTGAAGTVAGPITLNGLMNAGTGALTVSGPVTVGANNELVVLANTQATNITGAIGDGASASALTYGGAAAGTLTLSAINTYTGGTNVNSGTVALGGGDVNGNGNVRGTLTLNTGATVNLTGNNALGYNGTGSVTTVNVGLAATLNSTVAGNALSINQGFLTNFVLTGGTVSSGGGGSFNFNVAAATPPTISSNASTNIATFSAPIVIRNNGTLTFNVAAGVIGQDPRTATDLLVSGTILSDNVTTTSVGSITKTGAGVLQISNAGNTYAGGTFINAGTLLVNGTGKLGTGNVALTSTGALTLDSTTATAIAAAATLSFGATNTITLNNTVTETLGAIYDSDNGTYVAAGTYNAAALNAAFGVTSFVGGGFVTTAVPEPATWLGGLMVVGTFGFAFRRRVRARLA